MKVAILVAVIQYNVAQIQSVQLPDGSKSGSTQVRLVTRTQLMLQTEEPKLTHILSLDL